VFCSATFFCARKNASHFFSSGAKKRQLQPETLYAIVPKHDLGMKNKGNKGLRNAPTAR